MIKTTVYLPEELDVRLEAESNALVADLISENAAEYGIALPMSPADTATVLLSLGIGLGVQRAVDPTIRVGVLTDLIRACAGGTGRSSP